MAKRESGMTRLAKFFGEETPIGSAFAKAGEAYDRGDTGWLHQLAMDVPPPDERPIKELMRAAGYDEHGNRIKREGE